MEVAGLYMEELVAVFDVEVLEVEGFAKVEPADPDPTVEPKAGSMVAEVDEGT